MKHAMSSSRKKQRAASAALAYLQCECVLGVGTGTTVNCFIDVCARAAHALEPRSRAPTRRGRGFAIGIKVVDLNEVRGITLYVDGADEATRPRHLIKGGGGALTREKIVTAAASRVHLHRR